MTVLNEVHAEEAEAARKVLDDFREEDGRIFLLSVQRADRLEQAICEALVAAKEKHHVEP